MGGGRPADKDAYTWPPGAAAADAVIARRDPEAASPFVVQRGHGAPLTCETYAEAEAQAALYAERARADVWYAERGRLQFVCSFRGRHHKDSTPAPEPPHDRAARRPGR